MTEATVPAEDTINVSWSGKGTPLLGALIDNPPALARRAEIPLDRLEYIRNGVVTPTAAELERIGGVLGVRPESLMGEGPIEFMPPGHVPGN